MLSLLDLILARNQLHHNIGIIDSTGIGLLSIIGTSWMAPAGNIVDIGFMPGITGTRDGANPTCPSVVMNMIIMIPLSRLLGDSYSFYCHIWSQFDLL